MSLLCLITLHINADEHMNLDNRRRTMYWRTADLSAIREGFDIPPNVFISITGPRCLSLQSRLFRLPPFVNSFMLDSPNLSSPLIKAYDIFYTVLNTSYEAFPQASGLRQGARSIDLEEGHILLADEGLIQQLLHRYHILSKGNLTYSVRLVDLIVAVPTTLFVWRAYGLRNTIRYLVGFTMALTAQRAFISAMIGKIGREQSSLADALTLSRGANGAVLAGLVTSGIQDRTGAAGRIGWLMALLGVTDWLDGTLARRAGPTRLGGVLDIEADSWLTLWSAAGAVAWGKLPTWCLLPPLMHYLEPLLALMQGILPRGGGPWWYRMAGASQMGLLILALAPIDWRQRKRILIAASLPVSIGQCAAIAVRLARKLKQGYGE